MKKLLSMCAICALGTTLAAAQSDQPASSTADGKTVVANGPRDAAPRHENNWGLLGLLGLAGLAGLRRRERHEIENREIRRVA